MLGPIANLTIQNQAIGASSHILSTAPLFLHLIFISTGNEGLVTQSNLTFVDDISGLLGLGFPRLSTINSLAVNGASPQSLVFLAFLPAFLSRSILLLPYTRPITPTRPIYS